MSFWSCWPDPDPNLLIPDPDPANDSGSDRIRIRIHNTDQDNKYVSMIIFPTGSNTEKRHSLSTFRSYLGDKNNKKENPHPVRIGDLDTVLPDLETFYQMMQFLAM